MDKKEVSYPKEIEFFSKIKIVAIYAGGNASFAIAGTGALYVWGDVDPIKFLHYIFYYFL